MIKTVYTLKEKKNGELHLFPGTLPNSTNVYECVSEEKSVCGMMSKPENEKNLFKCSTEEEARDECAKIGKAVCGKCVSVLYENYG